MPDKILLVEDDAMIASGLVYALEQEGYVVTHCKSARDASLAIAGELATPCAGTIAKPVKTIAISSDRNTGMADDIQKNRLSTPLFDLARLDMQLPDGTGFDVRKALEGSDTAIIFLTVVDDEGNIVRAFEEGAEDYITKPFRLRELLARVKRALNARASRWQGGFSGDDSRGGQWGNAGSLLTLGGITIDTAAGKVYAEGDLLDLTALEYRLLLTFAQNKGQVLSRTRILENIWDAAGNYVEDNTLTVYIKRLREKLGSAVNIETVRGVGYRVAETK